MEYDRKKALISIHVPKCGGTSFNVGLKQWFGDRCFFHYFDERNKIMPKKVNLRSRYTGLPKRDLCIHGHFTRDRGYGIEDYYPKSKQFITFLRDPVEVQISLFFFLNKQEKAGSNFKDGKEFKAPKDIDEFLETTRPYFKDYLPEGIDKGDLKTNVEKQFVHIGVVENYQRSIDLLADKLGKPRFTIDHRNKSDRFLTPSNSSIEIFKSKSKFEYSIYNLALEMNK